MPQGFPLDRRHTGSYYAAVLLLVVLGACRPSSRPIAPEGLQPIAPAVAAAWAGALRPATPTQYDLRWRFTTQQGSAAGRAAVRYVGPDTLRFDYRAPFGRSGAALFVGPDVVWAQPEAELRELVPTAPLFWAGVGLPLGPGATARVSGLERGGVRAWRYTDGADVLDLVWRAGTRTLQAQFRQGERTVGMAEVQYDAAGTPVSAEIRFPGEAARFTFSFEAVNAVAGFAPDTWRRP